MKRYLILAILTVSVLAFAAQTAYAAPGTAPGLVRKIVILKPGVTLTEGETLVSARGALKVKRVPSMHGLVVLSPGAHTDAEIEADPRVDRVIVDQVYHADGKPSGGAGQSLPWGVDRVDADRIWGVTTGDAIKVAVIDTGIDALHPDLVGNVVGGYSAVAYTTSYQDDNGHGTHVAGTIAAVNNNVGVVGVAPNVDLLAVKVLDSTGSGYLSDVAEGIDWAVANGARVLNMSFGCPHPVQELYNALYRADMAGVVQVAAAGNTGGAVGYPAGHNEVIAVSAVDRRDKIASFSSRGWQIDLAAPGVNIKSTTMGGGYGLMSGTSMACPHVVGAAALVLTRPVGAFDADRDGVWDPVEVKAKLEANAEDLGAAGWDELYGSGLVDVEKAVLQ